MTRKDFQALASALKAQRDSYAPHWDANLFRAHFDACKAVADVCGASNPRFDRDRFFTACGIDLITREKFGYVVAY